MNLEKLNKYQTPVTEDLKKEVGDKVYTQLMDFITGVTFIQTLISDESVRGFAKDRPKHPDFKDGRILVDLTRPHILENMEFFRERAIFFQKNGKYTNITPNKNPKSEYAEFWKEELRRWKYGLVRPSDGEWISGDYYFYLNYSPIGLIKKVEQTKKGRIRSERIRDFAKPWLGDYLFYHYMEQAKHLGQHGKLLKSRGVGFSFKMASMSPRNMYVLPGSENPNFHLASLNSYLDGDKGIWGKVIDTLDWIGMHTPLPKVRLANRTADKHIQLGFQNEYGIRRGLLSSVYGISLENNKEKARGVRGPLIHYEEDGLFPDLLKAWNVNRRAVEAGETSFGFQLAGGTGGTTGAGFEGSKTLFYKPDGYNVFSIPNVFDLNINGTTNCGFFWGAYLNRENCFDELTGEPDVIKAMIEILNNRKKVTDATSDPATIAQTKAEEPITPAEAIMRTQGTVFPVSDLGEYLNTIEPILEKFVSGHYIGNLVYMPSGKVEWRPNDEISPIRVLPSEVDMQNRLGAVEIYEIPRTDVYGNIQAGRYIAGIDPIDNDTGSSLFSIMIMDFMTDRIVAEYIGRYPKPEDNYEIAVKLLKFYNAQANYETNLKGLFGYFKNANAIQYLCDTPEILKDMNLIKPQASTSKGTRATPQTNAWGRQLQASWMISSVDKNDPESNLKLHTLRSIGYIRECINWNIDGNFDRVSSANMLFILREDRLRQIGLIQETDKKKIDNWVNHKFFKENYDSKILETTYE